MGHELEQLGRIAAEVLGALVAVGSIFVQGMPAVATFLAIVWYLINILNSRPIRTLFHRKEKSK